MESLTNLVWFVPLFPLIGFLVLSFGGAKLLTERQIGWMASGLVGLSFLAAVVQFWGLLSLDGQDRLVTETLFTWIPVGGLDVDVSFLVDPLSVTMILFITGVGTLIHIYALSYMHGDKDFGRFFSYLNLFIFAMTILVLADNLLLSFLGWEGVGVCSYLLISFWYTDRQNASAGTKAFITNRVGDFGFMLAMFFAFFAFGSLGWEEMFETVQNNPVAASTVSVVVLCLMLGAAGKSAQIPLQVWLPDAMAGPTPVSALIHAATMVTAGVYLLVRVGPLLEASWAWVPELILWVGMATAIYAASVAMAQTDIKRVLAYSTVSQLGFMFVAIGVGAPVAALFHMITHAFFKALLFLGAGSVTHAVDGEKDINKHGGLAKYLPVTTIVFLAGWLAIAGVPPFSGFWSKDEILGGVWNQNRLAFALLLLASMMTAFYMSRLVFKVFFGKERLESQTTPHESPRGMLAPLGILAACAVLAGILNLPFAKSVHFLEHWLEPSLEGGFVSHLNFGGGTKWIIAILATAGALGGIWLARAIYLQGKLRAGLLESKFLFRAWYVNDSVTEFVGGPGRKIFEATASFDAKAIDGSVMGVASSAQKMGSIARLIQTGKVRTYALWLALGAVGLLAYFLARAGF